jgi:FRG domain
VIEKVSCSSPTELLDKLLSLCGPPAESGRDVWIFRGQADAKWPLASSLERLDGLKPLWDSEEAMLRQFREKVHIYSDFVKDQLTTVDALSIMQHHGAPTRLLDWTYSPAVAAFFAAADDQKSEYSTVWAANQSKIRYWSNIVYQYRPLRRSPATAPARAAV